MPGLDAPKYQNMTITSPKVCFFGCQDVFNLASCKEFYVRITKFKIIELSQHVQTY